MIGRKNEPEKQSEKVYLIYNSNYKEMNNDMKFIRNLNDIKNENFTIIKEEKLNQFGLKKENYLEYQLDYLKISDKIQQIIFRDKSKLNIINNKKLYFIESPNNINNEHEKNNSINYQNDNSHNSYKGKVENNAKIIYSNKNIIKNKHNSDSRNFENDCNQYIKAFFICLFKIKNIKSNFPKRKPSKNDITYLIYNFLENEEIKDELIKIIEKKIFEINSKIMNNLNFEILIDYLLDKLHEELNDKIIKNLVFQKGGYNAQSIYNDFKKNYFSQNESFIQKTFYGIKEISTLYDCCKLTTYNYGIIKYITFDSEALNKQNNLQQLLFEWEKPKILVNNFCKMCNKYSETLVQTLIYDSAEILIIIINNNKSNIEIDLKSNIKTQKYEYMFLCGIFEDKNMNNINVYNVIYQEESKNFFIINKDNNSKEINDNELNDLLLYPCVLFYKKEKQIIINDIKNDLEYSNNKFTSHIFTESNYLKESFNFMKNSNMFLINNLKGE